MDSSVVVGGFRKAEKMKITMLAAGPDSTRRHPARRNATDYGLQFLIGLWDSRLAAQSRTPSASARRGNQMRLYALPALFVIMTLVKDSSS